MGRPQMRDIRQNNLPVIFKGVEVTKAKKKAEKLIRRSLERLGN